LRPPTSSAGALDPTDALTWGHAAKTVSDRLESQGEEVPMIDVTIMWSNADDATFDHDYYLQKHIPMLGDLLGDKLKRVEVARGIGGSCSPFGATPSVAASPPESRFHLHG